MILRETSPQIHAAPDDLFAFFAAMEANYLRWHPDHVAFRWIDAPSIAAGTRFYFEERIGGKLLRKTVVFTRVEALLIEFAPVSRLFRFFFCRASRFESRRLRGRSKSPRKYSYASARWLPG